MEKLTLHAYTIRAVLIFSCLIFSCFGKTLDRGNHELNDYLRQESVPGREGADVKIIEGSVAPQGMYPWLVSLKNPSLSTSLHFCGGTIINSTWILTTASCVFGYLQIGSQLLVVAGEYNLLLHEDTEQWRMVQEIRIHPQFDQYANNYDAALLRVYPSINFGESVSAVPYLANSTDPTGTVCKMAGWGQFRYRGKSSIPSYRLLHTNVTIIPFSDCNQIYSGLITNSMICGTDAKGSPCNGDWGGALICSGNVLSGIASWSTGCGQNGYPTIYTDIRAIDFWILRQIVEK